MRIRWNVVFVVIALLSFEISAPHRAFAVKEEAASVGNAASNTEGGPVDDWIWSGMVDYDDPELSTGHGHAGGPGSYGAYTFSGTGIEVYGVRCPVVSLDQKAHRTGKAKVSIDGKERTTVDLAAADIDYHHKIVGIAGLPSGNHVLEVEPVGGWIIIDTVKVIADAASPSGSAASSSDRHLVAYWPLDEGHGAVAQDKSGHDHAAYLMAGADWTTDHKPGSSAAITFPNPGGVEALDPVVDTSKSFTVSVWVKLKTIDAALQTFATVDGTNVSGFYIQLRQTHMFAFTMFHGDNTSQFTFAGANFIPQTGVWYHLVGLYDVPAQTMAFFVNGQLQATQAFNDPWQASGHFVIGRGKYGGKYVDFATAEIADVRVYDTALSPAAVMKLYDSGR